MPRCRLHGQVRAPDQSRSTAGETDAGSLRGAGLAGRGRGRRQARVVSRVRLRERRAAHTHKARDPLSRWERLEDVHRDGSEALNTRHYRSVSDSLAVFARDPLLFPPGSDFSYSSYGFNLLGAALEGASGVSYPGVLQRTVLGPLHDEHTHPDDKRLHGRATFYEVRENRTAGPAPAVDLSDRYPSGGLVSTAADVAVLASKLGSQGFLTSSTQAQFFTEKHPSNGRSTGYGLGFEVADSPLGRFVRHIGNVVGGTAFALAHLESRVAIGMTTNVGWVTVRRPPKLGRSVPDPPQILIPFVMAARPK